MIATCPHCGKPSGANSKEHCRSYTCPWIRCHACGAVHDAEGRSMGGVKYAGPPRRPTELPDG